MAAEFALVKVRISQIELRAKEGNRLAKLTLSMLQDLEAYLSASQLGITLASLGLGWIGESVVASIILAAVHALDLNVTPELAHQIALPVSFATITVLHIVIGEQAPKMLAIQRPEALSIAIALPLRIFYIISFPAIWILNKLSGMTLRLFGVDSAHGTDAHTSDELRMLLDQSKESGEIQDSEHELIENVFQFNDRMVKQIMVPRTKLSALDVNAPADQILDVVFNEGYSRMPVYEGNIDNIVGVLNVKDLLPIIRRGEPVELARIMRPPYFVPETKKINRLLRQFQRKHIVMAIVSDEFGGVSGIVTIEDIMEEPGGRNPRRVRQRGARGGKGDRGRIPREPRHAHLRCQRVSPLPPARRRRLRNRGRPAQRHLRQHPGSGRRGRARPLRVPRIAALPPRRGAGAAARDHRGRARRTPRRHGRRALAPGSTCLGAALSPSFPGCTTLLAGKGQCRVIHLLSGCGRHPAGHVCTRSVLRRRPVPA
ncbi:hemolysin family protein [Hymenobacter humi]